MLFLNRFLFFIWNIALIGFVIAHPDRYEVKDADSNVKVNLLDLLNGYTQGDKEEKTNSVSDQDENWQGRWLPHHSGEPSPPPKVVHTKQNTDPFENWQGRWLPHRPGEPTPPSKIIPVKQDTDTSHHDNRIPMGVKTTTCDDGKTNLTVDWDHSPMRYTCFGQKIVPDRITIPQVYCETVPKHYVAMHKCMYDTVEYEDDIPLFGTHRPIWPVYGEYKYVPKQRWLHSLEHGGVVMLYHPCTNSIEVTKLKELVKGCLRRHIISPYELLDEERPLALLTWGCRLTMSHVNKDVVTKFIQENALHAPENSIYRDGEFEDQLIEKSKIVSDEKDSLLCTKVI